MNIELFNVLYKSHIYIYIYTHMDTHKNDCRASITVRKYAPCSAIVLVYRQLSSFIVILCRKLSSSIV